MTGGTCQHGFKLCAHSRCEIDCDDPKCEPTLEHEYVCDCAKRGCKAKPCTGRCGCGGCRRGCIDSADGE